MSEPEYLRDTYMKEDQFKISFMFNEGKAENSIQLNSLKRRPAEVIYNALQESPEAYNVRLYAKSEWTRVK